METIKNEKFVKLDSNELSSINGGACVRTTNYKGNDQDKVNCFTETKKCKDDEDWFYHKDDF